MIFDLNTNLGLTVICLSFLTHVVLDKILDFGLKRTHVVENVRNHWICRNSFLSLFHSVVTSIGSVYLLLSDENIYNDVLTYTTYSTYLLTAFSLGYFIHDCYHLVMGVRTRQTLEYLVHHLGIICCFGYSLYTMKYSGYAIIGLLVEIHSVFLHMRRLIILSGYPKSSTTFRIFSLFNLVTFVTFRATTQIWMLNFIFTNMTRLPTFLAYGGILNLTMLLFMNIVLFLRIVSSDFGILGQTPTNKNSIMKNS